jgi:hypothetical protein
MTKDELHQFMVAHGFSLKGPHFTAYHNPASPNTRYKVKKLVLRSERRNALGEWHATKSNYIASLEVNTAGKLAVRKTSDQNKALADEFLAKFA